MTRSKMTAMSILSSLVLLSILSVVSAQGTIQVTLETVDPYGNLLNGRVSVEGSFGRIDADSPLIYEQTDGVGVSIKGGWRGLEMNYIGVTISKETTYTIDPWTRSVTSTPTQGVTKVNIVFDPIEVTIATIDTEGNPLSGVVFVQNTGGFTKIPREGGDSDYTYLQANHGGAGFLGGWRGLVQGFLGITITEGMTYTVNALNGTVESSASSDSTTKVNFVFKPINVTMATVDPEGNPLNGVVWVQNTGGFTKIPREGGDSDYTYVQANGGGAGFLGGWRGLVRGFLGITITEGMTYTVNALSGTVESDTSSDSVTKVNFVFEPIEVTVAMVDLNSNPLYGWVAIQNTGGFTKIPRVTGDSSITYVQANGGGVQCQAIWSGQDSGWFGVGITKDTTYWINALTRQATSEWTPDTNKVNLFFAISATVDIDPDVLNLKSKGKWITCYIELPEGYGVGQIDIDRVFLEGLLAVQHSDIQDGVLMVKFDRQDVIAYIGSVLETVPPDDVTLTVMGELEDGTSFEGSDTISVID